MATNFFFRGNYNSYDLSQHGDGIYFAIDKGIIRMNGKDYIGPLGNSTAVKDIVLNSTGSKFIVTYLNGGQEEISVAGSTYVSSITNKQLKMLNSVGGYKAGTTVSDLENKAYSEIIDNLLFPTETPTITAPSATIAFKNYADVQEVGATGPTDDNFTTTPNRGSITIGTDSQGYRAGENDESKSFIFVNGDQTNTSIPTAVPLGNTTFQYRAWFEEGPQPKDNKGGNFGSPLAAGGVNSNQITLNGTWPWFASTGSATAESPVVKQTLVKWTTNAGGMSTGEFTLQPSGTLPQIIKLPRAISTLQEKNAFGQWDTKTVSSQYTEETKNLNVDGEESKTNSRQYYIYTYKSFLGNRGAVTLKITF